MLIRVDFYIDKETLIWAAWYVKNQLSEPLTKKNVISFLKSQLHQFGSGDYLIGAEYLFDDEPDYNNISAWVEAKFPAVK